MVLILSNITNHLTEAFSLTRLRRIFYLVSVNETSFEKLESVPNYIEEATPWVLLFVFLEFAYSFWRNKNYYSMNDSLTSFNSYSMQLAIKILFCGFEFSMACWLYENYGFKFLSWDSTWTWIIAFLLVDMSYYWFHRAAHEINFFWAFHQTHHSSEDYNLTTSGRQGMFQISLAMLFHLPEALILPPSVHMVHLSLNKLNQFLVHTQTIRSLGPLEHILVTPSHHRVHHGRNRYCIDKNYSGTLIIWDKIFGTFQAEKSDEPVAFGLVHNVNTFDALYLQFSHFEYLFFEKLPAMKTFSDKLKALFYGPGWYPGSSRLGNLSDIPEIEYPVKKYDSKSGLIFLYCGQLLLMDNFTLMGFVRYREYLTNFEALMYTCMIIFSCQCAGYFFENRSYAPHAEFLRCAIMHFYFWKKIWLPQAPFHVFTKFYYGVLTAFWFIKIISSYSIRKLKIV